MAAGARQLGKPLAGWRRVAALGLLGMLMAVPAPAASPDPAATPETPPTAPTNGDASLIIVAVKDQADPMPSAGGMPRRAFGATTGYAGGSRGRAAAAAIARQYGLTEQAAWTIDPLRLRCMLFRLPPGADQRAKLEEIARDPLVELVQPLNRFETLAAPEAPAGPAAPAPSSPAAAYNDPYYGLQRGFAQLDAAEAQRWSRGDGVRVALIDTAVDATHPDLAGRLDVQRDFVTEAGAASPGGEAHGTEMAGVITAGANNGVGIVGVAPASRLLSYRACWSLAPPGTARCDSFTLAQALGAAIAAGADIINLSLGGPSDPLLSRLTVYALQRGTLVVGAVPPSGRLDGFPVGVPGVLAVDSAESGPAGPGVLLAPGRDILTLKPGGHYDFASGSSLAAAHVTGTLALLRSLDHRLDADTARSWLGASRVGPSTPLDACEAVRHLRPGAACATLPKTLP